jgi:uncharacterized protein YndB with AHSA1/START domain
LKNSDFILYCGNRIHWQNDLYFTQNKLIELDSLTFRPSKQNHNNMAREKIQVDFLMRASPSLLYRYFTSPGDIMRWFCDGVDVLKGVYTFEWSGSPEEARLSENIEDELVRFDWLEDDRTGEYLEFKITKGGVTNQTVLVITDFCDDDEIEETKELWAAQIDALRKATGLG